jgi:hypothetical protein
MLLLRSFIPTEQVTTDKMKTDIMANINNRVELNKLKKKITDAAVALKIMMRSYQFSKDNESTTGDE